MSFSKDKEKSDHNIHLKPNGASFHSGQLHETSATTWMLPV